MIKLYMKKVFDKVEWEFLYQVLSNFGFDKKVVKLIPRGIERPNCSVLFNGRIEGSFRATRGLKHGDYISPILFIWEADVLSRGISKDLEEEKIYPYYTPRYCKLVTYLLYADDKTIFLNGRQSSLKACMDFLCWILWNIWEKNQYRKK